MMHRSSIAMHSTPTVLVRQAPLTTTHWPRCGQADARMRRRAAAAARPATTAQLGEQQQQQQQPRQGRRRPPPREVGLGPNFGDDGGGGGRGGAAQRSAARRDGNGATPPRQQQQQQRQGQHGGRREGPPRKPRVALFQGGGGGDRDSADNASSGDGGSVGGTAAALLTSQIMACRDTAALEAALGDDRLPALNAVHVSAALHQLSRVVGGKGSVALAPAERRRVELLVAALLERADAVAADMGGQELACCLGALARLGCGPPAAAEALLARSGGRLSGFRNAELLHLGWAAARLGRVPHPEWVAEFADETAARMGALNEQEMGNALWAFAKWRIAPPAAWLDRYLARLPAVLVGMAPPALASVAWAAAVLGLRLPTPCIDALMLEAQVKFAEFNAHGLATLAWALCSLDVRPRRLWRDDYVSHVGARMAGWGNDQCVTNTLWALSNWQHRPPRAWLDECCRLSARFLPRMGLRSLLVAAVALADLGHRPPRPWASLLLERVHARAAESAAAGGAGGGRSRKGRVHNSANSSSSSSSSRNANNGSQPNPGREMAGDMASFLWALSRLVGSGGDGSGSGSGSDGDEATAAAAGPPAGGAASRKAHTRWLRQYAPLLHDLAGPMAQHMATLPPPALVDAAVGCAGLGFFPGERWMDAHEAAVNAAMPRLSAAQHNLVRGAYARLEAAWEAAEGGGGGGWHEPVVS